MSAHPRIRADRYLIYANTKQQNRAHINSSRLCGGGPSFYATLLRMHFRCRRCCCQCCCCCCRCCSTKPTNPGGHHHRRRAAGCVRTQRACARARVHTARPTRRPSRMRACAHGTQTHTCHMNNHIKILLLPMSHGCARACASECAQLIYAFRKTRFTHRCNHRSAFFMLARARTVNTQPH